MGTEILVVAIIASSFSSGLIGFLLGRHGQKHIRDWLMDAMKHREDYRQKVNELQRELGDVRAAKAALAGKLDYAEMLIDRGSE